MRIDFEDKSYVEIRRSTEPSKLLLLIQARDYSDPMKRITNSVELTEQQLMQLTSEFIKPSL